MNDSIDILLSTYNGEKYLDQQIRSIINQQFSNWRLIIRDDGSLDKTLSILSEYEEKYPRKVIILQDMLGRLGPAKSFEQLAAYSAAPYVAFCDQDDVWTPEKLNLQLAAVLKHESLFGDNHPVLIHSDLYMVDEHLSILADSYWHYLGVKPDEMNDMTCLVTKNYVTGCTVLVNRCLLDLALPFPAAVIMHDWWIALLAVSNGTVIDMQEKTVKYRQHSSNVIGGGKNRFVRFVKAIFSGGIYLKEYLSVTRKQAEALLASNKIAGKNRVIVESYVQMFELGWLERRTVSLRRRYFRYGFIRNCFLFIYM